MATVSKNFWTSRSITQSFRQHRSRHLPRPPSAVTALAGSRRSPRWKIGLHPRLQRQCDHRLRDPVGHGGNTQAFWCPHRAASVSPPPAPEAGSSVPDDIRFQILYRLFFRSVSKSSIDCPSTPAAPLFALTRLYASHTSRFGI